MRTLRTIIIEDELHSRDLLLNLLQEYCPEVKVIGVGASIAEGIDLLSQLDFDLVFMDIELKDGKSFEIFNHIERRPFSLIFTTAYNNYALKAFKLEALDYLLKPYSPSEIVKAVKKVRDSHANFSSEILQLLKEQNAQRLKLTSHDGIEFVNLEEIVCCQADGSYCMVHLRDGQKIIASKTLGEIESRLIGQQFFRIHASYLINIQYIKKYLKADGGSVEMSNGLMLPISRRKKQLFLSKLA